MAKWIKTLITDFFSLSSLHQRISDLEDNNIQLMKDNAQLMLDNIYLQRELMKENKNPYEVSNTQS